MTNGSNGTGSSGPPCALETALVNSRRRIPYSVGSEPLATVSPDQYHARLDEKDERCLTVDILELYHVCFFLPLGLMALAIITDGGYRRAKTAVY